MIVILLSITTQGVYAQEKEDDPSNNKGIKFEVYTNYKAGYKISYPSDAKLLEGDDEEVEEEDYESVEFSDKNGEWTFSIDFWDKFVKSIEEEATDSKNLLKTMGKKILDEKPLTVAGQSAVMFSYFFTDDTKSTDIIMHANNVGYDFSIVVAKDKTDQYASLLFKILKSFELIE